ncbi:MAG: hypothetical protein A2312_03860 [Candidatus Staskawiczbacteria bacterium RIFOXYB2_FULL_32_9]|uniref:Uncharacterized protein n=1 Tax=Candidatus Staskawiczbacteria bacterium RIFOXYD1_FULL_32_13 TaxID=1802234 RepID=A0A1G2JN52_9BACT|nr:MAG: hypothetical protein UR22_C0008G0025 [Parcubacteria group bacterium GW2011_GWC2_32_10]OGZ83099.1 MAG: hypothetical protein A2312_03860 [Candidatus Staskawiczbacteria bacterium RIFOXYB2_FULL_32_9]OGZ85829.1 MAG: hypothetical protein A2463_04165 [Candidatus Staskawiczbacteria bacterium RIFOXYC2_FULL_32_10]OGZ88539.1 MAG: hypothetical protein A2561_04540 [Candidatus Staskawiczbacteria bacterium RIFOXYD1_FULL_32_13]
MDILQIIILIVVPSGIIGAIAGGLVNYLSNKNLDRHIRMMEYRRDAYVNVHEILSKFFDTVNEEESNKYTDKLLEYYRKIQIWGSVDVVRNFNKLLEAMAKTSTSETEEAKNERNIIYKQFVISMRNDILNSADLYEEDINIKGVKNN